MKPSNNYLQVLLPGKCQEFTITTDVNESGGKKMKVKGSDDNTIF
jgi:hypothetical protein